MQLKKRLRPHIIALIAILLLGASPFVPVTAAGLVATVNGCRLDEGSPSSCLVLGHDWGGLLYGMGALGWLGLATIPMACLLLLLWAIWLAATLCKILSRGSR